MWQSVSSNPDNIFFLHIRLASLVFHVTQPSHSLCYIGIPKPWTLGQGACCNPEGSANNTCLLEFKPIYSILKITFFVCVQHSFSLFLFSLPSNDLCWWFSPLFYSFCTLFPPFFAYFIRASFTCVHSAYYKLFVVWVTLNNKRLLWTITGSHVSFCRVSV